MITPLHVRLNIESCHNILTLFSVYLSFLETWQDISKNKFKMVNAKEMYLYCPQNEVVSLSHKPTEKIYFCNWGQALSYRHHNPTPFPLPSATRLFQSPCTADKWAVQGELWKSLVVEGTIRENGRNSWSCNPIMHCNLSTIHCRLRQPLLYIQISQMGGRVAYPTDSPKATMLWLCSSLFSWWQWAINVVVSSLAQWWATGMQATICDLPATISSPRQLPAGQTTQPNGLMKIELIDPWEKLLYIKKCRLPLFFIVSIIISSVKNTLISSKGSYW